MPNSGPGPDMLCACHGHGIVSGSVSLLLALGCETPAAHSGLWRPVVPAVAGGSLLPASLSDKANPGVRRVQQGAPWQSKYG